MAGIELFYDRANARYVISEDGDSLVLTEKEFNDMKRDGRSPLLLKLWKAAKAERGG